MFIVDVYSMGSDANVWRLFIAETVLKQVAAGTDGYITYPVEVETRIRAVNAVLSLDGKRDGG